MARHPRTRIGRTPSPARRFAVPVITTMVGSLAPVLPLIATTAIVPPFGLMVFLAWRALHRNIWPAWAGIFLGLWDDLFSGAELGTSVVLWTSLLLALDMLDRRLIWRDAFQEWGIAALLIAAYLLFAYQIGGAVAGWYGVTLMLPQMLIAALMFPPVMRVCDRLDQWRLRV
jgi:rod shape-determining protein MreD